MRFFRKNRWSVFVRKSDRDRSGSVFKSRSWSRSANENRWSISKLKSLTDFDLKIADRFSYGNRIPIYRSVCVLAAQTGFQSLIDFKMKFADRFWSGNRWSILRSKSITDFTGIIFDRDHNRDYDLKTGSRLSFHIPERPAFLEEDHSRAAACRPGTRPDAIVSGSNPHSQKSPVEILVHQSPQKARLYLFSPIPGF
jgi:hypothetical protein